LLQRRYFPEEVNDKYDPDKIYDKITRKIGELERRIKELEIINSDLKDKLEKQVLKEHAKIRHMRRKMLSKNNQSASKGIS